MKQLLESLNEIEKLYKEKDSNYGLIEVSLYTDGSGKVEIDYYKRGVSTDVLFYFNSLEEAQKLAWEYKIP